MDLPGGRIWPEQARIALIEIDLARPETHELMNVTLESAPETNHRSPTTEGRPGSVRG